VNAPSSSLLQHLLGLSAVLLCFACNYTAGLQLPDDARTIGIDVYGNNSNLRNLEAELTSEIARAVSDLVHLPLVPPDEADYVIRGAVLNYTRSSGARDIDNRQLQAGVQISISSHLVNRRTEQVIRSTVTALGTGLVIERGVVADDTPQEVAGRDRAIENLATRIVLDLFLPRSSETPL
jgi:hypothetical protein